MSTNVSSIIDAVMADLVANSGLSPTSTVRYAEPRVPDITQTPLLAVWSEMTAYRPAATGTPGLLYDRSHDIEVAWFVDAPDSAATGGTGDPATVQGLDAVIEQIVARVALWVDPTVLGLGPQLTFTAHTSRKEPLAGSMWKAQVTVTALESS